MFALLFPCHATRGESPRFDGPERRADIMQFTIALFRHFRKNGQRLCPIPPVAAGYPRPVGAQGRA